MPTPSVLDPAKPYVVLVLGRPGSGKSTLSAKLAERWGLPIVAKDAVKEVLFDVLGVGDVEWSMRLGRASFALIDYVIELQLQTGVPFLIDAAYTAEFENAKFRRWQEQYGFEAVQILSTASPDEIGRRFLSRAHDGTRHPGHADKHRIDEFRETLNDERFGLLEPLASTPTNQEARRSFSIDSPHSYPGSPAIRHRMPQSRSWRGDAQSDAGETRTLVAATCGPASDLGRQWVVRSLTSLTTKGP